MHPTLFEIGPITLHTYGLMIALGFLVILFLMQRDAKKQNIDPAVISELGFWSLFLGVLGTRLAHIIMYPRYYSWSDPVGWFRIDQGGLVFQGAVPVVIIFLYIMLKRRRLNFWQMSDIVMPYVPLAQAFGRMGCFFYGCCYGLPAGDLPWGITFPEGAPAYHNPAAHLDAPYAVHPTQLYSVLGLLLICGVMLLLRSKRRKQLPLGAMMPFYFIFYGIMRFIVEFYRGDGNPRNLGMDLLSNQQVLSAFMVLLGIALFIWLRRRRGHEPVLETG